MVRNIIKYKLVAHGAIQFLNDEINDLINSESSSEERYWQPQGDVVIVYHPTTNDPIFSQAMILVKDEI